MTGKINADFILTRLITYLLLPQRSSFLACCPSSHALSECHSGDRLRHSNITNAGLAAVSVTGYFIPEVSIGPSTLGYRILDPFPNFDASVGDTQACGRERGTGRELLRGGSILPSLLCAHGRDARCCRSVTHHTASSRIPTLTQFVVTRDTLGYFLPMLPESS